MEDDTWWRNDALIINNIPVDLTRKGDYIRLCRGEDLERMIDN